MQPAPRYYVRVGADVRGPVDEATVATWVAQGMRDAEVCPEGGPGFVPLAQTPLARHLGPAPTGPNAKAKKAAGIGTVVVVCFFSLFGRGAQSCNRQLDEEKKELVAALPTPGAVGVLHADAPLALCATPKHGWGWPCRSAGRVVADGSPVQLMKAEVKSRRAVCRFWVTGGVDRDAAGDGPCAWFSPR